MNIPLPRLDSQELQQAKEQELRNATTEIRQSLKELNEKVERERAERLASEASNEIERKKNSKIQAINIVLVALTLLATVAIGVASISISVRGLPNGTDSTMPETTATIG